MKTRLTFTLAGAALTALTLAGCSAATGTSPGAYNQTPAATATGAATGTAAGKDAAVATTALGKIIVAGTGITAYFFDKDKANSVTSACTGPCAAIWPAITTASGTPHVTGITGTVGTITGVAGGKQITINGRPIYTYAKDTAPGETKGQGINGVWYVISPAGDEIKTAAGRAY